MTCCSSTNAIAHGTPTMSALAVRTHKPLPPHKAPPLTSLASCDAVLEMRRRVPGETISRRARIRSDMVSDGKADGMRELVEREESAGKKGSVAMGPKVGGRMGCNEGPYGMRMEGTCVSVVRRVVVIVHRSRLGSFKLGVFDLFELDHCGCEIGRRKWDLDFNILLLYVC